MPAGGSHAYTHYPQTHDETNPTLRQIQGSPDARLLRVVCAQGGAGLYWFGPTHSYIERRFVDTCTKGKI